ncbi:tyrosine-type recombinase/integrase [Pontiellaceae bacterium B1224]|nr:tyrosine-type recombinase/integrase [Pontiellaceae bacterium B1224]
MAKGKSRGKRGLGRLYKRDKSGKEVSIDSNVNSTIYIEYRPTSGGRPKKQALRYDDGSPITNRKDAEAKRNEILAPLIAKDDEKRLENVVAQLEAAKKKTAQAEHDSKPALKLSEVWTAYKKSRNRPQSGKSTLNRYESVISAFTKWMKEHYPEIKEMRAVNTEHAEAYADHLEGKKLSPSSFNIYLNALSTVWATLSKKALIQQNPFAWDKATRSGIDRKNIKAQTIDRKKRPLTLAEANRVIENAEGDYRTLLIILLCTGQRLVDCVKLQWKSIDLREKLITLKPVKTRNRTGKVVYIPIIPVLREELGSIIPADNYVLPELVEKYNRDKSAITKQLRKIFNAAGLNAHKETELPTAKPILETGAHSLRHTFITVARNAGLPDSAIKTISGHSSEEMLDHYTTIDKKMFSVLANSLSENTSTTSATFQISNPSSDVLPDWAIEKLKTANKDNWESVINEVLKDTSA